MLPDLYIYLIFLVVLVTAIILDLGLLSKSSAEVSIKKAFYQTLFWISLAFVFFAFLWWMRGNMVATEYISSYLMEWSLSIDNIFVFILIFSFFKIRSDHISRALLYGILMAIILRIIFITIGVALVDRFSWILYVFGAFLTYTGIKVFAAKDEEQFDPETNFIYKLINRFLPIIHQDISGKLTYKKDGKRFYTNMFVIIVVLATTDIVFALDSIPAVFAITRDKMVIYTSNIFAVLGLRSLFFLLRGAVKKFKYLHQGIAIILIFIGLKMLAEAVHVYVPLYISLIVILICIFGSIVGSLEFACRRNKR